MHVKLTPAPAEVAPEAYGPIITECHTGDHRCKNCAYCNPDTNWCTVRSRVMSSPDTTVCMQWATRVPLQPDGSLRMKASETIGCHIINGDGITMITLHTRHCGNCTHQRGDAICAGAHEPVNYECKNWEPEVKVKTEKQQVFGGTSLKELEKKQKELEKVLHIESDMPEIQNERDKALNRGAKQGMTLEALETVFAIACQQVPSMEERWMELKAEINLMFAQKWAAEDMPE